MDNNNVNIIIVALIIVSISSLALGTVFAMATKNNVNIAHNSSITANSTITNTNDDSNTGCGSILLQVSENNSIYSYRRDAKYEADMYIKKNKLE
ncbi:MAG: hypothetical protein ACRC1M_04565 [Methanobacteriaceae archaeon]